MGIIVSDSNNSYIWKKITYIVIWEKEGLYRQRVMGKETDDGGSNGGGGSGGVGGGSGDMCGSVDEVLE